MAQIHPQQPAPAETKKKHRPKNKNTSSAPTSGLGILVTNKPKETSAVYTVRDPSEVLTLLQALVAWGRSNSNGWAQPGACPGQ